LPGGISSPPAPDVHPENAPTPIILGLGRGNRILALEDFTPCHTFPRR
jgi:hypothetical protein